MTPSIDDGRRSAARMAATPRANTTKAWPRAYMVASTIDRRASSWDPVMSVRAAMWSQSMPCRKPNPKAVTTNPMLKAPTVPTVCHLLHPGCNRWSSLQTEEELGDGLAGVEVAAGLADEGG